MNGFEEKAEMKIRSYAKVNLALYVTGKRDDGYHLIDTVMQKISLWDDIDLAWTPEEKSLDNQGPAVIDLKKTFESTDGFSDSKVQKSVKIIVETDKPYLPTDSRNLAYRAAEVMVEEAEKLKGQVRGTIKICVNKRIPVSAGLGGGSSNAAAVLVALNKMWGLGISTPKLCDIGRKLGADVPFCVLVHNTDYVCGLGTGIGDDIEGLKRGLRCHLVVAKPAFGVSTKEVYRGIDEFDFREKRGDKSIEKIKAAILSRRGRDVFRNMHNDLEEYTLTKHPQVERLKALIGSTDGVEMAMMTGSGPTVIGCYVTYAEAKAGCMVARQEGYEAYWCKTC